MKKEKIFLASPFRVFLILALTLALGSYGCENESFDLSENYIESENNQSKSLSSSNFIDTINLGEFGYFDLFITDTAIYSDSFFISGVDTGAFSFDLSFHSPKTTDNFEMVLEGIGPDSTAFIAKASSIVDENGLHIGYDEVFLSVDGGPFVSAADPFINCLNEVQENLYNHIANSSVGTWLGCNLGLLPCKKIATLGALAICTYRVITGG